MLFLGFKLKNVDNDKSNRILIMGLGNVLLGDEGIGIHVVKALEKETLPSNADIMDGGTGGFQILAELQSYPTVIMIDATLSEQPPGHIRVTEPRYSSDFPKSLSSHDIGLKDLLDSATLLEKMPKIYLVVVTIDPSQEISMELSEEVKESILPVKEKVREILAGLSC
jgi:hydrogenase maturation protease